MKLGVFSKDYSVSLLKDKCRQKKVSINDLMMAAISVTLKQYFLSKGDEKTSEILVMFPYNIRSRPKHPKDFKFCNEVSSFPFKFKLLTDMDTGLQYFHEVIGKLKNSAAPMGLYYLTTFILQFPFPLA